MRTGAHTDRQRSLELDARGIRLGQMLARTLVVLLSTVTLAAAAGTAAADTANPGTYVVYSCRTPDGALAPTDRWIFSVWASSIDHYGTTCPRGGLWMTMDPNTVHAKEDVMTALWTAPPDTLIVAYTMWRTARPGAGTGYYFTPIERRGGTQTFVGKGCRGDSCPGLGDPSDPLSEANRISAAPVPPINAVGLYVSCGYYTASEPDCPASTPAMDVTMTRADITLSDDHKPIFASDPVGGLLSTTTVLSGQQSTSFQVEDRGGGVADVAVEIDGAIVSHRTLGDNARTCATPYVAAVPCPLHVGGSLTVDTGNVRDGDHRLRLLARDAAGNVTAWGPIAIRTHNAPPDTSCVPDPAVTDAGSLRLVAQAAAKRKRARRRAGRSRLKITYERRTLLAGRLRGADRVPLGGQPVCLVTRRRGEPVGPWRPLARLTTASDGGFTAVLPTGPSRDVRAVYRVGEGAVVGAATIDVVPEVVVKARRRSLRNGEVLVLKGRLAGGPFPRRGVLLNVQAVVGRRWKGFADPFHTNAKGRFTFRYRFTRTSGVQRYRLRVHVAAQNGYPYAAGRSKQIKVRVRG